MNRRPNYLFEGASCFDVHRSNLVAAMDTLKRLDENTILARPVDDIVSELVLAHTFDIPSLRVDETAIDRQEVSTEVPVSRYDIFNDRSGGTRTILSNIVTFHVPFDGDPSLFRVTPSHCSVPGPEADIRGQELLIHIQTDQKKETQVRQEFDQRVTSIQTHLQRLRDDLRTAATQINDPARNYLEARRAQLLQSKNLVSALGFPMKRRDNAPPTFRAPEVRRKLVPLRTATTPPFKPEPALDEGEYQHILSVMDNMTKVMERSPHTFEKMREEDIRQHFLVQLNGQYEGQATGETFNADGKTDILIRSEGRNIFIAECKIWRGEVVFLETVNQLLSYITWRDSKSALVIFNRNNNLSGVLTALKDAMQKHPHIKRGPKIEGETRFRYVMGHPSDHDRELIMTVMVYDIPAAS